MDESRDGWMDGRTDGRTGGMGGGLLDGCNYGYIYAMTNVIGDVMARIRCSTCWQPQIPLRTAPAQFMDKVSVVQWHPFSLFFGGCPTKMVFTQNGFPFFPGSLNN